MRAFLLKKLQNDSTPDVMKSKTKMIGCANTVDYLTYPSHNIPQRNQFVSPHVGGVPVQSVVRTRPPLDFPCVGLGSLAISQLLCFLLVTWWLGTERVLELSDYLFFILSPHVPPPPPEFDLGPFRATTRGLKMSQETSTNDLATKHKSHYRQTQPHRSLPSPWMGISRRDTSMFSRSLAAKFSGLLYTLRWLSGWSVNLLTLGSVVRTRPLPLDFPCLGLGNLAVSQPSCFIRVAWQLATERVLQLNDYHYFTFYIDSIQDCTDFGT
ncbi:hypothetical protein CSKR_113255 [Clonorchis sinensis]|uniref:Uncharacterized protein n=1 Tax=Clonorchis sinensis TaxID=79923 RepID=A0A419PX71_CLOSI|nr:hypothetical protein CSKR_113255 [Clonorchis sinensis]